ncbi:hypothetical protein ACNF49_18585 [Actinomadura sp. ATCC 39365]
MSRSADVATALTCLKVETLSDLLAFPEHPDLAALWIEAHAEGDDFGDPHFRPPTSGREDA